ncbi:transposase OrfAB subunit B [Vibrio cholerae TM 11079-80]|nr:transposase OrfAB subunit B [Vibrio cholerae TM 11079-80]
MMIKKLKQSHSIKTLCEVFNVHRSSYNYWLKRPTEINAYFGAFRSVISVLSDHPFRFKPITDSAIIRSLLA